jgi:hypothetical protein
LHLFSHISIISTEGPITKLKEGRNGSNEGCECGEEARKASGRESLLSFWEMDVEIVRRKL